MATPESLRVGIFDSGVGGLTVVREVRRILPHLDILYFGDTARVPYGNKSPETIVRFSREIGNFLVAEGIEILVIACNTSSATALDRLAAELPVPVLGMIEPGAQMAVSATRNRKIGLIGTRATVASGAYVKAVHRLAPDVEVVCEACPLFVPLVEEGWAIDPVAAEIAQRYLAPVLERGVDTLILGCTHYPVLVPILSEIAGPAVTLVSSAEAAALALKEHLGDVPWAMTQEGSLRVFVTDSGTHFKTVGEIIMENTILSLEKIDEERLVSHAK